MNTLLILFLSFLQPTVDNISVQRIRYEMVRAVYDEKVNDSLFAVLHKKPLSDPKLVAYKGITEALNAKHAFNPYTKIKYLFVSESTFNDAVALAPNDLEVRFLRFSIQYNCPRLPMFRRNLEEDKNFIIVQILKKNYPVQDTQFVRDMIDYLLKTTILDTKEREVLQNLL